MADYPEPHYEEVRSEWWWDPLSVGAYWLGMFVLGSIIGWMLG